MIRVENLVKSFGKCRVLDGVNLTVVPGEVTALVGPSGGGKSTLLRCLNGLETYTSGRIAVFDHVLPPTGDRPHSTRTLVPVRRAVGMVFQQFHLFPHLSVLHNVMSGPMYAHGRPAESCRAECLALLARVGLAEFADAAPARLSGGQQQRVAIARALAVHPRAVLFDEPTSALDPAASAEVLAVFRDLASSGQTMVVVTHDFDLARQAHTVHRMEAGRVAQSGPPAEVLPGLPR